MSLVGRELSAVDATTSASFGGPLDRLIRGSFARAHLCLGRRDVLEQRVPSPWAAIATEIYFSGHPVTFEFGCRTSQRQSRERRNRRGITHEELSRRGIDLISGSWDRACDAGTDGPRPGHVKSAPGGEGQYVPNAAEQAGEVLRHQRRRKE